MKMLLVNEVDGHETTPLGVVKTRLAARVACIKHATQYVEDGTNEFREQAKATGRAFDEAWTEAGYDDAEDDTDIDVQFESAAGSWDYQVVSVEVIETTWAEDGDETDMDY